MTATLHRVSAFTIRDARPRDNDALRDIALKCPMRGDVSLCVKRDPDFFALSRLEGPGARVAVAEAHGNVVGCVMVAGRDCYMNGVRTRALYTGDFKVHPTWRGWGAADALSAWVCDAGEELAGPDAPMMLTILAGNRAMEQRLRATEDTPEIRAFARIRAHSVPLLWKRGASTEVRVDRATVEDIEEMAALWSEVAPARQFATCMSAEELSAWTTNTPGLSLSDYRVARDRNGRIAGFVGWWNQSSFKQTIVTAYSRRLRTARHAINAVAAVTGSARLPEQGAELHHRTAVHVCVPGTSPAVLRALVLSAFGDIRDEGVAFVNIGLDVRDPLTAALGGLFAQPTDVGAYILTPRAAFDVSSLDGRPLHYEIGLV